MLRTKELVDLLPSVNLLGRRQRMDEWEATMCWKCQYTRDLVWRKVWMTRELAIVDENGLTEEMRMRRDSVMRIRV